MYIDNTGWGPVISCFRFTSWTGHDHHVHLLGGCHDQSHASDLAEMKGVPFFEKPTWEWCHGSWEYVWIYILDIYIYNIKYAYIIIYISHIHIYIYMYIYISVWEPIWFQTLIKQHQMNDGYGYVQEWRMPQRIVREFVQGEIWRSNTKHNE